MSNNKKKSMEERFDKQYSEGGRFWDDKVITPSMVKSFLRSSINAKLDEVVRGMEGMKKKHHIFECNGPRKDGTRKYEDWCDDENNCQSNDAVEVRTNNAALSSAIERINKLRE